MTWTSFSGWVCRGNTSQRPHLDGRQLPQHESRGSAQERESSAGSSTSVADRLGKRSIHALRRGVRVDGGSAELPVRSSASERRPDLRELHVAYPQTAGSSPVRLLRSRYCPSRCQAAFSLALSSSTSKSAWNKSAHFRRNQIKRSSLCFSPRSRLSGPLPAGASVAQ